MTYFLLRIKILKSGLLVGSTIIHIIIFFYKVH